MTLQDGLLWHCDVTVIHDYDCFRKSAWELSPQRVVEKTCGYIKQVSQDFEILIAYAEHDSPEFRRQSVEYYEVFKFFLILMYMRELQIH